ncbi:Protein FAM210A, partial [Pseudolycoriella hygida]
MAGLFSRRYLQSLININKSFNVKSMSYYNMQHANCALMPISQLLIKTNTNSFLNSRISKTVFSPHLGHNSLLKSNFTSSKWGWNKKSETVPSESEQPKKQGIVARFKELTRKYWYVLVPVHLVTSAGWLTGFYYLSTSGVDMVALLQALSINETIIENMKDSSMGHYAITYMCYKIATPVRYTVTIGGTTISIKYLSKWGYIKPMPTKEELQKMYDDKKAEMKQNFDDKKAQMIQDIEDRKTQMLQDFDDKKAQIKQ